MNPNYQKTEEWKKKLSKSTPNRSNAQKKRTEAFKVGRWLQNNQAALYESILREEVYGLPPEDYNEQR